MMTPPSQPPRVRIVTLNYEGGALTLDCLAHLVATDWPAERIEIVLVDNASTDGVADRVRERWPHVRVICSPVNRGFAGGINLGLTDLDDVDHVALVNNDVTVEPGWLAPLVDVLEADPELGAACPKVLFAPRYVEVEITSTTSRRGRGDGRNLGVRVAGVEVDGVDVVDDVQWWKGFWGPEPVGAPGQWTSARALLRAPVARGLGARTVRLRLEGPDDATGRVELGAGGAPVTAARPTGSAWYDVPVGAAPIEVVNNAGSILTPEGYGADRGYLEPDDGRFDEPTDVFAWCGAAVVLPTRYLRDVGLLDERLFLYYEDLELSWRGRERGWRYRYVPDVVVRHVHSATVGEHSSLARYQNERNRLLVLARHASVGTAARAAGRSLLITASYARRDLLSPVLHGHRPRGAIVRDRARAFAGYLRLLPSMARDRQPAEREQPD